MQDKLFNKITLILYLGILILPFGFYFIYDSLQHQRSNHHALASLQQANSNAIRLFTDNTIDKKETIQKTDQLLKTLQPWFEKNNKNAFYVGGNSLIKDFYTLNDKWNALKTTIDNHDQSILTHFTKQLDSTLFGIEKIVKLTASKIDTLLIVTFAFMGIVMLLLVYFVRTYTKYRLTKHAIHDHQTGLFNQKYFDTQLETMCAKSQRHDFSLSLLCVKLKGYDAQQHDKQKIEDTLGKIGKVFGNTTRKSDVAARYTEECIMVMMPFTDKEHGNILKDRLKEALEAQAFKLDPKIDFDLSITEYHPKESAKSFVQRACELL